MITADRDAYRAVLPEGGRLLGLDVGTKTIGTALCDAGWSFASPATLIRRRKFTQDKADLAALVAAGTVRPVLDRTFPLAEAAAAITYLETEHARAKVVLTVP